MREDALVLGRRVGVPALPVEPVGAEECGLRRSSRRDPPPARQQHQQRHGGGRDAPEPARALEGPDDLLGAVERAAHVAVTGRRRREASHLAGARRSRAARRDPATSPISRRRALAASAVTAPGGRSSLAARYSLTACATRSWKTAASPRARASRASVERDARRTPRARERAHSAGRRPGALAADRPAPHPRGPGAGSAGAPRRAGCARDASPIGASVPGASLMKTMSRPSVSADRAACSDGAPTICGPAPCGAAFTVRITGACCATRYARASGSKQLKRTAGSRTEPGCSGMTTCSNVRAPAALPRRRGGRLDGIHPQRVAAAQRRGADGRQVTVAAERVGQGHRIARGHVERRRAHLEREVADGAGEVGRLSLLGKRQDVQRRGARSSARSAGAPDRRRRSRGAGSRAPTPSTWLIVAGPTVSAPALSGVSASGTRRPGTRRRREPPDAAAASRAARARSRRRAPAGTARPRPARSPTGA